MRNANQTGVQSKRCATDLFIKNVLAGIVLLLGSTTGNAENMPMVVPEHGSDSPSKPDLWINAGMISYHFNREIAHRDLNWGYGVQSYLSESVSVLGGNFINSKYVRSNYVAFAWQPLTWHSIRFGFEAGALDGYPGINHGKYFFAAMPCLSIRGEVFGLNVVLVPYYSNNMHSSALTAQMIMRVW